MPRLDVKYILFSHYSDRKEPPNRKLARYQSALETILHDKDNPGLLILFWDPGWRQLFSTVGADFDPHKFAKEYQNAEAEQNQVDRVLKKVTLTVSPECREKTLADRVRFVTAADLYKIVNNLRGDRPGLEAKRLRQFLSGEGYDTAKVIEAIVHIRHIGANVPVFRLDWDVLFNDDTLKNPPSEFRQAIKKALDYYKDRNQDPHIYSFLFSASYKRPKKNITSWRSDDWMGAFATRVFPALLAQKELLENPVNSRNLTSNYFNSETIQKFYGIEENALGNLEIDGGITEIGGNPLTGVISGALLCMSDGAILDLPPFSNFSQLVTWIDDHLKYALYRELKHLEIYQICGDAQNNKPKSPIVEDCQVTKARGEILDIAYYVLGNYLPTLLCGCIVDAWIQPDPRPKIDGQKLDTTGVLSKALQEALKFGRPPEGKQLRQLKQSLKNAAYERIEEVRSQWEKLKGPQDQDTFASLWVGDPQNIKNQFHRHSRTPKDFDTMQKAGDRWVGWGIKKDSATHSITSKNDLNPGIAERIDNLIEDVIIYIEWALEWPKFIQSVRAVEPGKLRIDLSWQPK